MRPENTQPLIPLANCSKLLGHSRQRFGQLSLQSLIVRRAGKDLFGSRVRDEWLRVKAGELPTHSRSQMTHDPSMLDVTHSASLRRTRMPVTSALCSFNRKCL